MGSRSIHRIINVGIMVLLMAFLPPQAKMRALDEAQLETVSGQSGIDLLANTLGLQIDTDTLCYHDDDGVTAGDEGAFLSFCNINHQGSVTYGRPVRVQAGRIAPIVGGGPVAGISYFIDDMTLTIDTLSVGAIRVGPALGQGLSFGALALNGLEAHISGQVQIYFH